MPVPSMPCSVTLDEEIGETRNRARRHGHARILRRKKSLAGARDHVKAGFPRNLFQKSNVTPDIIGRQVDNGVDTRRAYEFKFLGGLGGKFRSATLRPFVQKIGPIGNMFMRGVWYRASTASRSPSTVCAMPAGAAAHCARGLRSRGNRPDDCRRDAGCSRSLQKFPPVRPVHGRASRIRKATRRTAIRSSSLRSLLEMVRR